MKYNIITPIKNEERFIRNTIISVLNQKQAPKKWLIIDDNSSDNSISIINSFLKKYNFIELIPAPKIQLSEISARIAYIFNYGFDKLSPDEELLMKLDGDIILPPNYCSTLVSMFAENLKLGIASGCAEYKGKKEKNVDDTLTRGAAKFYRVECFNQIGCAYLSRGWDTIDNYAAQSFGWETKKFDIYFKHEKKEGTKSGLIMLRYWTGLYNGRVPYYLPYFLFKIVYYLFERPVIIGSILEFIGYINARIFENKKPFPDHVCEYVRKVQKQKIINTLVGKK
jgi:glycosyltransferase involved in cell wall biosynthesis